MTDYSEKLLDILEIILWHINKPISSLSEEEGSVAALAIDILADMIEYQILEHRLTLQIMNKKYSSFFKSLYLKSINPKCALYESFLRFTLACRIELEDLELDEKQINLLNPKRSDEEKEAFDTFVYVNDFIFPIITHHKCLIVAKHLSKVIPYIMSYGISTEVLKELSLPKKEEDMEAFTVVYAEKFQVKLKEITDQLYRMSESEQMMAALIIHELGKKAESKQLRNIDFLNIKVENDEGLMR